MPEHWTPIASSYDPLKAGSIDGTDEEPHDQAICRAMHAKYKPNKHVVGTPENTIFVGRLSPNTDEEMLEAHFVEYGKIKRLRLVRDIVTGFSRCYGFIEYFDQRCAHDAQKYADKTVLDEKEIYVDYECERTLKGWIPRRLGGGIGGKKESGQLRFGGKNRPFKKPYNINLVQKPEGSSFRDRLTVVESGEYSNRDRSLRHSSEHQSSNVERYDSGSRYRESYRQRPGSKERYSKARHRRSRSRDRRSRSYERESRSSRDQSSRSHEKASKSRNNRPRSRERSSRRQ